MLKKKELKKMETELKRFQEQTKELEALTMAMLKANERKLELMRTGKGW